ncbi:putative bifunctional diguanylate cyclase/phosphodiesterase [Micromonospora psammae]|uniref:putative bifunctional diguanylate cyclase/phosphodiesterase n=1 Tax=Micromonospora sp. CPCC 205556 TaxID=3122398 RepID=UPI002FF160B1
MLHAYLVRRPPSAVAAVLAVAALLTGAAVAGPLAPLAATTLAAALGCAVAGVRLSRLAADGGGRRARRRRRAAALLDAAVMVVGLTVAVLPLADPAQRPYVTTAGLAAAALTYGGGLLLLPGHSRLASRVRLRRGVDVLGLGAALLFAGWVLLPPGEVPPLARVVTVAGAGALAGLLVSAFAERYRRPGAALCRAGAAAAVLGLGDLAVLLAYRVPEPAVLSAVAPLVAGPLLTAAGMARVATGDPPRGAGPHPAWSGATAPAALATLAAGWHLWVFGGFTPTAVLLGLAVIPPLVVRELLATADARRRARRLAAREARFRTLVSGGRDLVLLVDDELRVSWLSGAGARWFDLHDEEVLGRPLADLLHPEDVPGAVARLTATPAGGEPPLLVARLATADGGWRETESTVSDQRGTPEVGALVLYVRDVGERRRLERESARPAATDQPTGLVDRRELLRALDAGREGGAALLLVELHGLGGADDGAGRAMGDAVLVAAARRMRDVVGPRDLVARVSGEEFAVVTGLGPVPAYALGARLLATLSEPCPTPGAMVRLRVSIGLAELAGAGPEDVLRQAELARRRAAQLGGGRVEWYDPYLEEQLVRRLDVERELPGAVARGELDLVYQPVLGLTDRLPVGTEALLRWRSPVLGTVLPAELLPVAEDLGLVGELGRWVLDRACRQLAEWSTGGRQLWMAVNVTPRELLAPEFLPAVAATLAGYGVPAERLVVEVGEPRVGAELPTVVARLAGLRSLGVRTALDDFRAEHASLAQLRRLPIDLLKVRPQAPESAADPERPLIDVVVSLGDRLGLEVVMEELESDADVDRARRAGCRYGQGFALARPATAERVEAYFEEFPSASR